MNSSSASGLIGPRMRSSRSSSRARPVAVVPSGSGGHSAAMATAGSTSWSRRRRLDGGLQAHPGLGLLDLDAAGLLPAPPPGDARATAALVPQAVELGRGRPGHLALAAALVERAPRARSRARAGGRRPAGGAGRGRRAWPRAGAGAPRRRRGPSASASRRSSTSAQPARQERCAARRARRRRTARSRRRSRSAAARSSTASRACWRARACSASADSSASSPGRTDFQLAGPCPLAGSALARRRPARPRRRRPRWPRRADRPGRRARRSAAAAKRASVTSSRRATLVLGLRRGAAARGGRRPARQRAGRASASARAALGPRLFERRAGGTGAGRADPPARSAPNRSPSRVTTTAPGWASATSSAAVQPPSTTTAASQEAVEQAVDGGIAAADVAAHRLTAARYAARPARRSCRATAPEGEHGAVQPARVEPVERLAGPASRPLTTTAASASPAAASNAASQPVSTSTRSSRVPTTPSTSRQLLGPGLRPGLVEGEGERLGPCRPRVPGGRGRLVGPLGLGDRVVGAGPSAGLGLAQLGHEPGLGGLGVLALGPQPLGLRRRAGDVRSARAAAGSSSRATSAAVRSTAADQVPQLAPHLGGRRRRGRAGDHGRADGLAIGRAAPLPPPARSSALGFERLPIGGHIGTSSARIRARLGLERGDHRRVEQPPDVALGRPPPLGQHGGRGPGPAPGAARIAATTSARSEPPTAVSRASAASTSVSSLASVARSSASRCAGGRLVAGERGQSCLQRGDLAAGEEAAAAPAARPISSPWRRAASAWRSSGRSWRRTSRSRSCRRSRLRLGGLQPALGLLLALAELEDAGRLLDDRPPVLGPGVEDGVDLPLADDDVLLAADAGVGEQLLDVEQAAGHAVDGVLALARPEQDAADRDLGELDRQEAGRVVDRDADLGPSEGGALVGAGEDDVVHLLAAHRARGLRTEHPGDGVHHVRLAAAVRPHDHRDTRLQLAGSWRRRRT